jgi:hypothetical protein
MGTAAPAVTATVETANDGTFTIIDLPPGDYRITVTMDHYIEQEFGQRVVGGRGKPVTVHAGARHEAVNFRLTRSSVIGGTVLDPAGSPMANAEVQAFVYVYGADGSGRNLEEVGDTGRTDSLGKYRLQDLTPGEYLVTARQSVLNRAASAGMRGGGPGAGVGRGNAAAAARSSAIPTSYREIFVPVFYPGVDDPDQAAAVSVPPGADVHGIDFTLAPTTASRLIGVVLPPKNGAKQTSSPEPSGVDVFLIPLAFGGVSAPSGFGGFLDEELTRRSTATAGNGSFQFFGIVPGSYRVVAVGGEPENPATAIRDIDIRPGTTPELTLELRQGVDIAGQIYADGRTPPDFKVEQLTVMLELTPELRHNPRLRGVLTKVNADGSFVLRNAVPGARYRVRVGNAARGRASSSLVGARYGEADPLSAPIIAREGAMPLEIIVGFAFGRVEATVVNDRTPQQDITTALIPRNRARHDLYRVQQSDARGKVSFDNVPAGDYEIYAWEDVRQSHWFDPRFMKTVEDKGLAIHVDGSGTSSEIVPMITIGNGDFH